VQRRLQIVEPGSLETDLERPDTKLEQRVDFPISTNQRDEFLPRRRCVRLAEKLVDRDPDPEAGTVRRERRHAASEATQTMPSCSASESTQPGSSAAAQPNYQSAVRQRSCLGQATRPQS